MSDGAPVLPPVQPAPPGSEAPVSIPAPAAPSSAKPAGIRREPWLILLETVLSGAASVGAGVGLVRLLSFLFSWNPRGPVALLILFTLPAGLMGAFAVARSRRSPEGVRRRLGLVRPHLPLGLTLLLVPATWGVWLLAIPMALLGMWLFEPKHEGLSLFRVLADLPSQWLPVVVAAGSVCPGIGEELLFRGYLQRGLQGWWRPVIALTVTSLLFALGHQDPVRVFAIVPIAFWFGFIAFRSGSIIPGMACHMLQNVSALTVARFVKEPTLPALIVVGVVLCIGVPCLVLCMVSLVRLRRARTDVPASLEHSANIALADVQPRGPTPIG